MVLLSTAVNEMLASLLHSSISCARPSLQVPMVPAVAPAYNVCDSSWNGKKSTVNPKFQITSFMVPFQNVNFSFS